ncbi:MAG: T9SS type A sorting domain-containing protein [Bacteroidales bacterium]|nr:T9SS type A sorting domain-containing protein [Bacteroidales bacterium]
MKKILILALVILLCFNIKAQKVLLPTEEFNSNIIYSGNPNEQYWIYLGSNEVKYFSTGGCEGGYAGYTGSWNNFYSGSLVPPLVKIAGAKTVKIKLNLSNSYEASSIKNYFSFAMWDMVKGAYDHPDSVYINGVKNSSTSINFTQARVCDTVEVYFTISTYPNSTSAYFYLDSHCYYNNSSVFSYGFDNITIYGYGDFVSCIPPVLTTYANGSSGIAIIQEDEALQLSVGTSDEANCDGKFEFCWFDGNYYYDGNNFSSTQKIYNSVWNYIILEGQTVGTTTYTVYCRCDADASCASEDMVTVDVVTGIINNKSMEANKLNAYISDHKLYLNSSNDIKELSLNIYDIKGRKVFDKFINSTLNKSFDLSFLTAGLYYILIYNKDFKYSGKIIYR